jgi:hypothetical protein
LLQKLAFPASAVASVIQAEHSHLVADWLRFCCLLLCCLLQSAKLNALSFDHQMALKTLASVMLQIRHVSQAAAATSACVAAQLPSTGHARQLWQTPVCLIVCTVESLVSAALVCRHPPLCNAWLQGCRLALADMLLLRPALRAHHLYCSATLVGAAQA